VDQFAQNRIEHLEGKVSRLESKINAILEHLKIQLPDEATETIKNLIRQGKKADAVVFYHREKGGTLTEANAAVEKIAKEM
jgi:hypothetical protein